MSMPYNKMIWDGKLILIKERICKRLGNAAEIGISVPNLFEIKTAVICKTLTIESESRRE
jgi:hypothetical protein